MALSCVYLSLEIFKVVILLPLATEVRGCKQEQKLAAIINGRDSFISQTLKLHVEQAIIQTSLPTASASFLRFSACPLDAWSRRLTAYLTSFSSSVCSRLGFRSPYDVCRTDGCKYS